MDIIKKYLTNGQYLTTLYEKFSIFIHHTVGTTADSAWRWWNSTPDRVGTAYVIDRDGTIIECFDPTMWAYHLGIKNDDNYWEKHSINIELVSAGGIIREGIKYRFYPLWPNTLRYTNITTNEVFEMSKLWRGYIYFHNYSEDQLDALKWLIGKLSVDFSSLKLDNNLDNFWEYNEKIVTDHLHGIWSHSSVRKDKSDIFPYPPLIEALKEVQSEIMGLKMIKEPEEIKKVEPRGEATVVVPKSDKKSKVGVSGKSKKPKS